MNADELLKRMREEAAKLPNPDDYDDPDEYAKALGIKDVTDEARGQEITITKG